MKKPFDNLWLKRLHGIAIARCAKALLEKSLAELQFEGGSGFSFLQIGAIPGAEKFELLHQLMVHGKESQTVSQ